MDGRYKTGALIHLRGELYWTIAYEEGSAPNYGLARGAVMTTRLHVKRADDPEVTWLPAEDIPHIALVNRAPACPDVLPSS